MNRIIYTACTEYIDKDTVAQTGDDLRGCFISCIIYESGEVIMGHYGPHPSFGKIHLAEIRGLKKQFNLNKIKEAFVYSLRKEDFIEKAISLEEYSDFRGSFKDKLENLINNSVKLKAYVLGSTLRLDMERNLSLGYGFPFIN